MAKTTAEKIKVMQAYDNDYKIEACALNSDVWFPCPNPNWNWGMFDFRIKKESTKRPMTIQEIFDYWKEHRTEIYKILVEDEDDEDNDYFYFNTIQAIDIKHEVVFFNPTDYGQCFTPREMFDYVTKEDGTKFEVEE